MDEPSYSLETNVDAKIQRVLQNIQVTYTCTKPKNDMNSICLSVEELKNIHDKPKFDLPPSLPSNSAGSTSDGSFYECKLIDNNWNSTITTSQNFDLKTDNSNYPEAFAIRIYINNEIVDEMKISLKDVNNYE